jgi:hypothetical protein
MELRKDRRYSAFVDSTKKTWGKKKSFLINGLERNGTLGDLKKSMSIGEFLEKSKAKFEKDELENENTKIVRMLNEFLDQENYVDPTIRFNNVYEDIFEDEPFNNNGYSSNQSSMIGKLGSNKSKEQTSPIKKLFIGGSGKNNSTLSNSPMKNKITSNLYESNDTNNSTSNLLSENFMKGKFIYFIKTFIII